MEATIRRVVFDIGRFSQVHENRERFSAKQRKRNELINWLNAKREFTLKTNDLIGYIINGQVGQMWNSFEEQIEWLDTLGVIVKELSTPAEDYSDVRGFSISPIQWEEFTSELAVFEVLISEAREHLMSTSLGRRQEADTKSAPLKFYTNDADELVRRIKLLRSCM